jgi:hypothetical protein
MPRSALCERLLSAVRTIYYNKVFYKQRPHFHCPVCRNELPPLEPGDDRHVKCGVCGTSLVYDFKYFWFYRLIGALVAIIVAYLQKLQGPFFVVAALFYFFFFCITGAKYLLPLFPIYVKVAQSQYTILHIDKNE